MRTPIANLTDSDVLSEPRLTQSVLQAWVSRMIGAGWKLVFDSSAMFVHADEHNARISHSTAEKLAYVYWKTLKIPSPYNYLQLASVKFSGHE